MLDSPSTNASNICKRPHLSRPTIFSSNHTPLLKACNNLAGHNLIKQADQIPIQSMTYQLKCLDSVSHFLALVTLDSLEAHAAHSAKYTWAWIQLSIQLPLRRISYHLCLVSSCIYKKEELTLKGLVLSWIVLQHMVGWRYWNGRIIADTLTLAEKELLPVQPSMVDLQFWYGWKIMGALGVLKHADMQHCKGIWISSNGFVQTDVRGMKIRARLQLLMDILISSSGQERMDAHGISIRARLQLEMDILRSSSGQERMDAHGIVERAPGPLRVDILRYSSGQERMDARGIVKRAPGLLRVDILKYFSGQEQMDAHGMPGRAPGPLRVDIWTSSSGQEQMDAHGMTGRAPGLLRVDILRSSSGQERMDAHGIIIRAPRQLRMGILISSSGQERMDAHGMTGHAPRQLRVLEILRWARANGCPE